MRYWSLLAIAALSVAPLAAQDADPGVPWRTSYFPYFNLSPNEGFLPLARVIHFRQADYEDRVSLRDALAVEGGYSTRDSWLVRARGDFPRLAPGWRFETDGEIGKAARFGTPGDPQERKQRTLSAEITRQIKGPLMLALRGTAQHVEHHLSWFDVYTLYPNSAFTSPCQYLVDPSGETGLDDCSPTIAQHDVRARAALVLDLRDREFETNNGALVEAGLFTGSASDGYHGVYGMARGWISPRPGTRLTARLGFRAVSRSGAVGIQHELPLWEHSALTFGGPQSQRGYGMGSMTGRGLMLGGVELRHDLLNMGDFGAITAFAFADGGRAFQDLSPLVDPAPGATIPSGALQFTFKDWKWSGGGGVGIRVLRAAQLNITAARGDGQTRWYVSSGWAW